MLQEGDVTGKEVTKKVRSGMRTMFGRLTSLSETPTCESPYSDSPFSASPNEISAEDLSDLVGSIDGTKSGTVQYTLLVAALLPWHVYRDDLRISEVFKIFAQGHSKISPHDLRVTLKCPKGHRGRFSRMVRECDLDGDGAIDLAEFRSMVRGEIGSSHGLTPAGRTPAGKIICERKWCLGASPLRDGRVEPKPTSWVTL